MKALSNKNKLKALIAPNMADLITFLDNSGKSAVYTELNIHGLYCYLEIIGAPTTLTTSGQRSHHFCPSYSINNFTATLQTVIADLYIKQKIICERCVIIVHKAGSCIIRGSKFLSPSLIIKMNRFNTLNCDKTTDPTI